tara:strand:+ start:304 stop:861 length:558 start_codon:yes stop_codon:yes gene_type:complete
MKEEYILKNYYKNDVQNYINKQSKEFKDDIDQKYKEFWTHYEKTMYRNNKRGILPVLKEKEETIKEYDYKDLNPILLILKTHGPQTARDLAEMLQKDTKEIVSNLYHGIRIRLINKEGKTFKEENSRHVNLYSFNDSPNVKLKSWSLVVKLNNQTERKMNKIIPMKLRKAIDDYLSFHNFNLEGE